MRARKFKGKRSIARKQSEESELGSSFLSGPWAIHQRSFESSRWADFYGCVPRTFESELADAIQAYIQAVSYGTALLGRVTSQDAWPDDVDCIGSIRRPVVTPPQSTCMDIRTQVQCGRQHCDTQSAPTWTSSQLVMNGHQCIFTRRPETCFSLYMWTT